MDNQEYQKLLQYLKNLTSQGEVMKNGQFNSENIMITYIKEIKELYQYIKLSGLYL